MNELSSWNYHWSESGGSSWNEYLRNRDVVRAVNAGTATAALGLSQCMTDNTRQLVGSVESLERSMESGFFGIERSMESGFGGVERSIDAMSQQIVATFSWGFSEMLSAIGGMQTSLDALLKVAKTPAQTAAFEQFEIARDAFRQGLFEECLESLDQAIGGVSGVSAGYKLEWRFHQLRGLVLLGSHENFDSKVINSAEAEKAFLLAARYARKDYQSDAAKAMLSAGWSAYVQADGPTSTKLRDALAHTEEAVALDPQLGEALFQVAKFQMAAGSPDAGLPFLRRAADFGGLFIAKAVADGDFKRFEGKLIPFLEALRREKSGQLTSMLGEIARKVRALQSESQQLAENPVAKRVVAYGTGSAAVGLVELAEYSASQWAKDEAELKKLRLLVKRSEADEWEEEVVEKVATGKMEQFEETIQETYFEEEILPGGWFRKESKVQVKKTRPKTVIRERAGVAEVRKKIRRRGPEKGWLLIVDGFSECQEKWDIRSLAVAASPCIPGVWIEPGRFQMGSPTTEEGRDSGETQHMVTLTRRFFMAEAPCTQAQWQLVMGSKPSEFDGGDRPVEHVSWKDAMAFCRKLTEMHRTSGLLPEGWQWGLPTEAQWEYACRAGTTTPYAGDLDAMGWYDKNSESRTHAVKTKRANAWGLYDMHGNGYEWCSDWYGDYPAGNVTDPRGPASGSCRVFRGGSWYGDARRCRSAYRISYGPDDRLYSFGFRPVLAPGQ